ncbi:MAG: NADH-quinone oxidoreductase subunit NuoG [Chromatiales bacterium]
MHERMNEHLVNIEVDGVPLKARKGAMIMEITDAAGIYIPRFCYHKKLSIAANCRMCLVQVEKVPKPLPACATPVMEGMKVYTRSPVAREAQQATMEFLLINHPLDCPICDQGGECELQDLAMGYGSDVSRYTERKRVVKDKDIGPLIQTDMTRCIHCTRCVRFGEEIAGLRELGATGRGEQMEIGTYVERAVTSELSGNVIDLCPVGALTSKPYRYTARAWELRAKPGIAPHDCVGSNIELHVKGQIVKRVVPRENEAVNEVWLSDRDRYSYEGLNSAGRLRVPMIKEHGRWREVDWETALKVTAARVKVTVTDHGVEQIGALASPSATVEELYLFQKLLRALGVPHIDHRLRQGDFRDQDRAPIFPWLAQGIAELERADAVLLVGSNVRKEQPMANHRLRKASMRGAKLMVINPVDFDFNWHVSDRIICRPSAMIAALAGVARVLAEEGRVTDVADRLHDVRVEPVHRAIATRMKSTARATILLGNLAIAHPNLSILRTLAQTIARLSGKSVGYLCEGANGVGAWLAGVLPHRGPAMTRLAAPGLDAAAMLRKQLRAYLLLGVEPELDCWDSHTALLAMQRAGLVVALTAYRSAAMEEYAHAMLPIALFAETAGTYVNAEGRWQSFDAAVKPPGEARPAWKVLRVLGNTFGVAGFDYMTSAEVREELRAAVGDARPDNSGDVAHGALLYKVPATGLERVTVVPAYSGDPLVRHARALQDTGEVADGYVRVSPGVASSHGLIGEKLVRVEQGETSDLLPLRIDPTLPDACVLIHGAGPLHRFGPAFGSIKVERA